MKRWCNVIQGCGTGILSIAMFFSVGCREVEEAGEATGEALEQAGQATMDAAGAAGDEIQDVAGEVEDEL